MTDRVGQGVPGDRDERARVAIAREPVQDTGLVGTALSLHRLCRVGARLLPAEGVAVSLVSEQGLSGVVAALDPASDVIEELLFVLGEGPGWDCFETRVPVLVPDLAGDGARQWPGYGAAAGAHDVSAVFAFPLTIGSARLGVLDVYRAASGPLSDEALAVALVLANLATGMLVDGQEGAGESRRPDGIDDVLESRFAVYQAQGMVMIQLGVSLAEAMARMRAHAYSEDRTLGAVARDVVARRLSFEGEDR